jgi:hypothetical protein
MRSMQDYRDLADKLVTCSYEDNLYSPVKMCGEGAKGIEELAAEVERLRGKLTKKRRKFKRDFSREYATWSPNARGHAKLQTFDFKEGPEESEKMARQFADQYRGFDPKENIHADAEAAGLWRYIGPWNYLPGYEPVDKDKKES